MGNKVEELLKESGAILVRSKKHQIWKLPNGKTFVRAKTSSCKFEEKKSYNELRNLLGLVDENRGQAGERRAKKNGNGRTESFQYNRNINTSLADKLSLNGVLEETLRKQIEVLENQNKLLIEETEKVCLFCQIKLWFTEKFNRKNNKKYE